MLLPEVAYQFRSSIDLASNTADIVSRKVARTQAAVAVAQSIYTVPLDRVLVLNHAILTATTAGAAITALAITWNNPGSVAAARDFIRWNFAAALALVDQSNFWDGQMWFPPGVELTALGSYQVAGASNTIGATIHGLLLPRGNVSVNM